MGGGDDASARVLPHSRNPPLPFCPTWADAVIVDHEAKVTDTDRIVLAALLFGLCEAKPRRFLPFAPREIGVEKS
jgi:hypothetical protein